MSTAMFATKYYVPGLNMALIVSFVVTVGLTLLVIPYGKRRKPGTPVTWGEAMLAADLCVRRVVPRPTASFPTSG